jgi:hydrogenase nickel incorporation protein HypA/HybF
MHETHVVDNLVHQVVERAQKKRAVKILKISVKLGAFSLMSPMHFREHFNIAAQGTIAENAELEIETSDDIHDPNANRVLLKSFEI